MIRKPRRFGIVAASVAVAASALLAGCASGSAEAQTGTRYVAGDGATVVLAPAERTSAPELKGTTLDGAEWSLADQRGYVTVVNVWASWCAPCRTEAPALERAYLNGQADGLRVVGLDTRDTDTAAKAFIERYRLTYPNLADPDGTLQLAFHDTLPPQSIPSTVFLDKQGRVAARVIGKVDDAKLADIIGRLQQEPA